MSKKSTVLIFAFLLLGFGALSAQIEEKSLTVTDKDLIQVSTIAGNITVTAWDKPGQVQVKSRTEGLHVKPVYEQKDGKLVIREDHDKDTDKHENHGAVHFDVFVPRNARLNAHSISGDVKCEGLSGELSLTTVSGDVLASVGRAGGLELNSVSGNIDCSVKDSLSAALNMKNVSGDVTLSLPAQANAKIAANTISGKTACPANLKDFRKVDRYVGERISGSIGSGQYDVKVSTVSGDITLR